MSKSTLGQRLKSVFNVLRRKPSLGAPDFVFIAQIRKSFRRKKTELSEKGNLLKGRFNLT